MALFSLRIAVRITLLRSFYFRWQFRILLNICNEFEQCIRENTLIEAGIEELKCQF